ncbi:Yae1 family protein [Enhygromyxa salina]|uniref:Yae1 family protein n=1 Tax=Enhygromyxa salina TaxID=215803 RepID=UPI000698BAB7|nr:Yae1 family protein [Enhygromyxa salina]
MAAGTLHQGTLELFRHDPWLAFDLLGVERPVVGTPIDRRAEVERNNPKRAGQVLSNFPDLVLVHEDGTRGVVICVEAQGKLDLKKRWLLPYYQAALAKDHKLPTWIVVVSYCDRVSEQLAAWKVGHPPAVNVLLLDAHTVAPILDVKRGQAWPTAAVLGAALHGCRGNLEAARAGLQSILKLPNERRDSYRATLWAALPKPMQALLKEEMTVEQREEIWDVERRSGAFSYGHEEGLEAGREEGLEAGREEGLEVGLEVGLEEGQRVGRRTTLVELILTVLEVRGVALQTNEVAQIRGCDRLETLERWAKLAREVNAGGQLFEQG